MSDVDGRIIHMTEFAQAHDIWARRRDDVVVFVADAFQPVGPDEGRIVAWVALPSGREGICTERYFVKHYRLLVREA